MRDFWDGLCDAGRDMHPRLYPYYRSFQRAYSRSSARQARIFQSWKWRWLQRAASHPNLRSGDWNQNPGCGEAAPGWGSAEISGSRGEGEAGTGLETAISERSEERRV